MIVKPEWIGIGDIVIIDLRNSPFSGNPTSNFIKEINDNVFTIQKVSGNQTEFIMFKNNGWFLSGDVVGLTKNYEYSNLPIDIKLYKNVNVDWFRDKKIEDLCG
jgi:hypothetical protein